MHARKTIEQSSTIDTNTNQYAMKHNDNKVKGNTTEQSQQTRDFLFTSSPTSPRLSPTTTTDDDATTPLFSLRNNGFPNSIGSVYCTRCKLNGQVRTQHMPVLAYEVACFPIVLSSVDLHLHDSFPRPRSEPVLLALCVCATVVHPSSSARCTLLSHIPTCLECTRPTPRTPFGLQPLAFHQCLAVQLG